MIRRNKLIIMSIVFVDVMGFGIVIPILPFYVESLGASAFLTTLMFASFAFCAFISSPFLGALSDRIGRRPVIIASIISTAVGWTVFASATSVPFLFLGRIIDGLAAGNYTTAQSYLVDISRDEKERTANLGLIGATFGVGFILGPMIGGLLSGISHATPFWFAGAMAALNAAMAFFFLPESHHRRSPHAVVFNPLRPLYRAATDKQLRGYYGTWVLFALSFVTGQAVLSLYVGDIFGFTAFDAGMLFTGMGVVMTLNQTVLLRRVWQRYFSSGILELLMIGSMVLGFGLMGTESLWLFFLGVALNTTAQSLLRVVITSEVAGQAPPHAKGEAIGILASLMAASMAIAPVIAGAAFEVWAALPYFLGMAYMILAFALAYPHRKADARPEAIPAMPNIEGIPAPTNGSQAVAEKRGP